MSTTLTEKETEKTTKRGPTSLFIDKRLWLRVKRAALDAGTTATDFVESALDEKLKKVEETEGQG